MISLGESIGAVAPFFNLGLVLVVVSLFLMLFNLNNKRKKPLNLQPWKFLYAAILIYIVEELLTVLGKAQLITHPRIFNAFFEFVIIILFIYLLLAQKEHLDHVK